MTKPKLYASIDAHGFVTSVSHHEAPPDGLVEAPHDLVLSARKIRYVNGQFVQTDESWIPSPTVAMARSMAYPSVGDQLGAIWKALAPLIEHPEAEAILAKIQAVKDANQKPSN